MASTSSGQTLLCRGIPLLSVPLSVSGEEADREKPRVSVHQLSVELWQRFDTPRASVQRKIEDLRIRLYQCTRPQVTFLRDHGVIDSFRATAIKFEDAERLCDGLQRSRDKRGLAKHPLKPRGRRDKRRAEELWMLRLSAKKKVKRPEEPKMQRGHSCVDEKCALNGDDGLSTPAFVTPAEALIEGSSGALQFGRKADLSSSLQPGTKIAAGKRASPNRQLENGVVVTRERSKAAGRDQESAKSLDALDLSVAQSDQMSVLRYSPVNARLPNHLTSRRRHHSQPNHLLSHPLQTSHAETPQAVARCTPNAVQLSGIRKGTPPSLAEHSVRSRRVLHSPDFQGEEDEEEAIVGAKELRRSRSSIGSAKKGERFLFLSSEEEEEEEDVVIVKVTDSGTTEDGKKLAGHSPRPHPCQRRVLTKLRHFAHTTSPNASSSPSSSPSSTSSTSASPGKHLPFGSSHHHYHYQSKRHPRNRGNRSLWVRIPLSLATPTTTPTTATNSQQPTPPAAKKLKQHLVHTTAAKSRPKASLSSFVTLKRARNPSPTSAAAATAPHPARGVAESSMAPVGKKIKLNRAFSSSRSVSNGKVLATLLGQKAAGNSSGNGVQPSGSSSSAASEVRMVSHNSFSSSSPAVNSAMQDDSATRKAPPTCAPPQLSNVPMSDKKPPLTSEPPPLLPFVPPKMPKLHKLGTTTTTGTTPSKVGTGSSPGPVKATPTTNSRVPTSKLFPLVNGVSTSAFGGNCLDDDRGSVASSSSLEITSKRTTTKPAHDGGGQRSSRNNGGCFSGNTSTSSGSSGTPTFKFNDMFGYYPPKLIVQDGDLCPEYSLSLSGLDRGKLNNLPPSHPFWSWTLGQPTNRNAASAAKTGRRKNKGKGGGGGGT